MEPKNDNTELYKKIVSCMEELAEAKGLARCGLMYALAHLIETLQSQTVENENAYREKIIELEAKLKETETE